MSKFKREVRYTVIKHNQLTGAQIGFLKNCIHGEGIPTVKAVVVESDWPEYEPVWKMIEDRVTGAPVEGGKEEYDTMAKAMTKDKTVTMSRELAESLLTEATNQNWSALNQVLNAPTACRECMGTGGIGRLETCEDCKGTGKIAAPVVERQETVGIEGMPQYLILFDDTERPVETMFGEQIARKRYADISMSWNAHLFVKIDSNSRDAMFAKNNATVYTSPPELAELQAIISRLTADVETMRAKNNELNDTVERLKGGQGEAVAWFTEDHLTDKSATTYDVGVSVMWAVKGWPVTPLYTSPPAPVAVVLPTREVMRDLIAEVIGGDAYDCTRVWSAWSVGTMSEDDFVPLTDSEERLYELADACLDKVKELNQ